MKRQNIVTSPHLQAGERLTTHSNEASSPSRREVTFFCRKTVPCDDREPTTATRTRHSRRSHNKCIHNSNADTPATAVSPGSGEFPGTYNSNAAQPKQAGSPGSGDPEPTIISTTRTNYPETNQRQVPRTAKQPVRRSAQDQLQPQLSCSSQWGPM